MNKNLTLFSLRYIKTHVAPDTCHLIYQTISLQVFIQLQLIHLSEKIYYIILVQNQLVKLKFNSSSTLFHIIKH